MKKIITTTIILLFLLNTIVLAQPISTFQWAKKIMPTVATNSCGVNGIATDNSGNLYTTGWFSGTTDFGGTFKTSSGGRDFFIAKYNTSGTLVWVNAFGAGSFDELTLDIKVDASSIYICGAYSGSNMDFDPGPGTFTYNVGSSSGFVAKYDQNGNFVWAQQSGYMSSLDLDKFGNIFVAGLASSSTGFIVFKYDNSGNNIGGIGGNGTLGFSMGKVKVDSTGNLYLAFGFAGTVAFSSFTLTSSGSQEDIGLAKFTNTLGLVWSKKIGGTGSDWGSSRLGWCPDPFGMAIDNQQNLCITGLFAATVNFGSGNLTAFNSSNGDGFFAKYNGTTGTLIFVKQLAGAGSTYYVTPGCIQIDANDNINIAGYFNGSVDCDPGPGSAILGSTTLSLFWSQYDINGNYLTNGFIGSATYAGPSCMLLKPSGLFFAGGFAGTQDFDMGASSFSMTGSPSYQTGFISKYNYCSAAPSSPSTVNGLNSFCPGAGIQTYSVTPVSGATSYTWSLPGVGWTGTSSTNTISIITGTTSGNISVTANNACGSSSAAVLSITVNPNPTITVNSGSICSGSSFTMIPSGANTYTFSGGSAIVSPTTNTSYSVTGTSTAGCVGSNTAIASVTVNSNPTANAGSSQTITCISANVNLTGSGVSTYTWSGPGIVSGGNTSSPVVNMAGTYSLVGSTSGCNSNTVTVNVASNTVAPTLSVAVNSNSICIGNSATLTASGASTYSWSTSSTATSVVVSPTVTTNYVLTGTNSINGCTNTFNQSIGVNSLPVVTANTSSSIICGPPFQGTATITASGASTYTWNTSATTTAIAVSPSVTTVYTVTGADANGCMNFTSFTQSVSACTGIEQFGGGSPEFGVYPNPTSGVVTIKGKEGLQIHIYNIIGELIISSELKSDTIELDLSNHSNGIYFIRIGSITKKIIKE
jgi:hypothetical protein